MKVSQLKRNVNAAIKLLEGSFKMTKKSDYQAIRNVVRRRAINSVL